jgi:Fe-S-cluster-containing dehydrogenase component
VTACQAACPSGAIAFGNLNDPNSRAAKLKADPRNYSLLGELNTVPRTTYLAAVKNPNPELS